MRKALLATLMVLLLPCSGVAAKKTSGAPSDIYKKLSSLVFSGQEEKAIAYLKGVKGQKLKGIWQDRLKFLAAVLYLKAEKYDQAADLLKQIQKSYLPLQDYVAFYLAIAQREGGKAKEAIAGLNDLKNHTASAYLKGKIDRELALAYCKAGDRGNGVDLLNGLIQNEPLPNQTNRLRFDRARCLVLLGDKAEAAAALKKLYLDYPEGEMSGTILAELRKLNPSYRLSAAEHIARAELLLQRGRPELAILDFEEASRSSEGTALSLKNQIAEAYFKARKYREAAAAFETLRRDGSAFDTAALEKLAKAYSRSDQFDSAIATYEELVTTRGRDSNYLYKIAFIYMDKGDYATALQKFSDLLSQFPGHPQREQIQWYIFWNQYLLGQYDQALISLDAVDGKLAKRAPYWRARIYEKQGQEKTAKELYEQIAVSDQFSYYGFLALKRLDKNLPASIPPKNGFTKELPALKVPKPFSVAGESYDKKAIGRVKELLMVGLWEDFLGELNLITSQEGAPAELTQLKRQLTAAEVGAAFSTEGSWSQKYPAAYPTLVPLFAQTRNIPPALAWAIMREESHFRAGVVSPANAIGLMQIIPPTGFEIAGLLGRGDFSPEHLYQPVVNIEFGVHYLAMNLSRFDGNLIFTIASYNAGPDAVERWGKARPNREWDEFVEEIPYDETNNYVKKVLKSYYLYDLLYKI